MSQSPKEASPIFEGLPFSGLAGGWGGAGRETQAGKGFKPGHSWKAGLLACLFKSQVIWEEGGSVCTARAHSREELLRRSQPQQRESQFCQV